MPQEDVMPKKKILVISKKRAVEWEFHNDRIISGTDIKYDFAHDLQAVNLYLYDVDIDTSDENEGNLIDKCIEVKRVIENFSNDNKGKEEERLIVAIHFDEGGVNWENAREKSKKLNCKVSSKKEADDIVFTYYSSTDSDNQFVIEKKLVYYDKKINRGSKLEKFVKLMVARANKEEEKFFESYLDRDLLGLAINIHGLNRIFHEKEKKNGLAKAQRYLDEIFEDGYLNELSDSQLKKTIKQEERVDSLIACLTNDAPPQIEEFAKVYLNSEGDYYFPKWLKEFLFRK